METILRKAGSAALGATGVLHLALVPEYLEEQPYIGVLFVFGGMAAIVTAVWLWTRGDGRAWLAAGVLAAGMGIGFVLSRTTGLPGFHEAEWEASGVLSLALEGIVLACAVAVARSVPLTRSAAS